MSAAGPEVLFVVPSLEAGGAERVVVNLANGLADLGVTVRVLATGRLGAFADRLSRAVATEELDAARVRAAVPSLVGYLRRRPADVILATHTHLNLALCAMRPLMPRSMRLVLREPTHAPVELDGRSTRGRRILQRTLYRRADLLIATSSAMEQDLRRLTGARTHLLANPVEAAMIRAAAVPPAVRDGRGRRFVSVGRIDSQKCLPDLLGAFADGSGPSDELILIGEGPAGAATRTEAERLGITHRVRMLGFLPRPWTEVAAADAFLLASRAEGMPNAVLESLAVGTPVIAADDLTVLQDVRSGAPDGAITLVPRDRLAAAIGAVRRAEAHDPSTLRASLLPERFDAATATASLHEVLRRLVLSPDGT